MQKVEVPRNPNALSSEWLTSVLHETNLLPADNKVAEIQKTQLSGGFNGTIIRLQVKYEKEGGKGELPSSFVVKFMVSGRGDNTSKKELEFFKHTEINTVLGAGAIPSFRIPQIYYCNNTAQRYLFLEEDLSYKVSIPQNVGANFDEARLIVGGLAAFHAKFWSAEKDAYELLRNMWCPFAEPPATWQLFQNYMLGSVEDGLYEIVEDDYLRKTAFLSSSHLAKVIARAQQPPCTLVHGDARASNYFIDNALSPPAVVAIDWQGFEVGNGGGDLAYFISMSVQEDVRKTHESDLIRHYYDTLTTNGVKDFSFEECKERYLLGLVTSASVPVLIARGVLEGKKFVDKPPSNPALAETAKTKIAMFNDLKPMIDRWCSTVKDNDLLKFVRERFA